MNQIVIAIPLYTDTLKLNELKSLHQCCRVLSDYSFSLIAPKTLDTSIYEIELKTFNINYSIERFSNLYFQNIEGYNRLMLSKEFYERFQTYKFILIYQLDAYVFRNELEYWCKKNYDFIGAPLIGKHTDTKFSKTMKVGNGGFSLRKTDTFMHFFNSKKNVFSSKQIVSRINLFQKPYTRLFVWFLMVLGWRNKPKTVSAGWKYNEDDFWSNLLDNSKFALKKPEPNEALLFAFERFPSSCFKLTEKIPFGCHAWEKYEYNTFWHQYIK